MVEGPHAQSKFKAPSSKLQAPKRGLIDSRTCGPCNNTLVTNPPRLPDIGDLRYFAIPALASIKVSHSLCTCAPSGTINKKKTQWCSHPVLTTKSLNTTDTWGLLPTPSQMILASRFWINMPLYWAPGCKTSCHQFANQAPSVYIVRQSGNPSAWEGSVLIEIQIDRHIGLVCLRTWLLVYLIYFLVRVCVCVCAPICFVGQSLWGCKESGQQRGQIMKNLARIASLRCVGNGICQCGNRVHRRARWASRGRLSACSVCLVKV